MKIALASEWENESEEWLIPGLLCDSMTLVSGEPKSGKTSLAAHIVRSLLTQTTIINREPAPKKFTIAWMGFDAKWTREIRERLPEFDQMLYLVEGANYKRTEEWGELGPDLKYKYGVNLLVIDHLYGFGAGANLDRQLELQEVLAHVDTLINKFGIAVILLTQAGRAGDGRAAHSVASEGFARWLVRIKGKGKTRSIEVLGNNAPTETFKVILNPKEIRLVGNPEAGAEKKDSGGEKPEIARFILQNAPLESRKNEKALGKWLASQNLGVNTPGSGRQKVGVLIKGGLLAREGKRGLIIPGPNLVQ